MTITPGLRKISQQFVEDVFGVKETDAIQNIPPGKSGDYEIRDDIDIQSDIIYQTLLHKGNFIMDNNPNNLKQYQSIIKHATGKVLINGLGVGASLHEILKNPDVTSVLVVEKSREIIELVGPSFIDPRVTILYGDAFSYDISKEQYDAVWHAIWHDRGAMLKDRDKLIKKYQGHCKWQGFLFAGRGGQRSGAGRKLGVSVKKTVLKPENEKRIVQKGVRCTQYEERLIQKASEISGKTESEIIVSGAIKEAKNIITAHSAG